jgi:hypothetical protein
MKKFWLILIALVITISAVVYQKMTGPTYPKRVKVTIDGKEYKLKLPRSHAGSDSAVVSLPLIEDEVQAFLLFKRYKVDEEYTAVPFIKNKDGLIAKLPGQPPAGKLEYYIEIDTSSGDKIVIPGKNAVVIRFKGKVPTTILLFHIFFMFFAMFYANYAGILAIASKEGFYKAAWIALGLLFIGGMILGPIVQKFAFGEYWTGIPFGWDLTDNKTLIAFVTWIIAILLNLKNRSRWAIIVASLITILVFSIPHSMYGSELNYKTGTIQQG